MMKNLLDHTQNENPSILYQAKLHWSAYIAPIIYILFGSVGILGIFIMKGTFLIVALLLTALFVKGLQIILKNRSIKIYITEGYLSISSGIFSKTIIDISLNKMEGMQLHQTLVGKTLNFGNLMISTGAISQSYTIANPVELRKIIMLNK